MALIDKASLLMVPSVYEDGTLYNVLPSGNKAPDETGNHNGYDQTRADFTFSRGFNLTATRVNANGLIEKGRENLLLQSNAFDTTWINANSTETSGQADKDGGTNAWKIDITGVGGRIYQSKSQSGVVTFSVYAKKGTLDWVILSSNVTDASFNLATGEKGTLVSGIDSNIEAVGETGWYRCSFTGNGSFTQFRIYPAIADNTFTASSGNIYIQDAQAETSLVATDYIETGATTATAGVLENTPRIDYSSGAGALLLEPQRTNLYTHSEYSGAWNKTNWTTTDNYAISPEGVKNAFRAVSLNTSGILYVSGTGVTGQKNTLSVWAKSNTGSDQKFRFFTDGNTNTSSDFTATTEWQRFEYTYDCAFVTAGIKGASAELSDILFYGFQHETGSYPTSYIPTYGAASTRGADSCNNTSASAIIGQTEGTLFAEIDYVNTGDGQNYINISDGTLDNRISVSYNLSLNCFVVFVRVGGSTQALMTSATSPSNGIKKIAVAYKLNDYVLYINGTQIAVDSSALVPACSNLQIGSFQSFGGEYPSKQALVFKTRLTNAELASLTTL